MKKKLATCILALGTMTLVSSAPGSSFSPQDHGRDHDNPSHGNDRQNGRQESNYRFRQEDAPRLRQHYSHIERVNGNSRPHYSAGQHLPEGWSRRVRPVPDSVYRQLPTPPRGYRMGYIDGYAVAYNPATQIIADVLDLAVIASRR